MSRLVDVSALAAREGLRVVEVLKEGYDHDVYLVERDGMRLVLKTIVRPQLRPNLQREIAYSTLVATLAECPPGWTVRTAAPRASGEHWVLRDHADAGPLLREDDLDSPEPLRRVARALADLDGLAPDPRGARPAYRDHAGEPRSDTGQRLTELERWVGVVDRAGALGRPAEAVLRSLRGGRDDVRPGLEVWDVKLDDFLDLPEGRVGLFDLEFAHLYGRRHYDVAALANKLAVRYAAPGAAAELLRAYVDAVRCDRAELARAASPVLAETLLSQLFDAVESGDGERAGRAGRLFGQCLDGGLEALLDEVAAAA
jgi:hypothetical protein